MISPELRAKIRRLFYAEHWKIGTIVDQLSVHPDTVRQAIESDRFAPTPRPIRPSLLDPYKALIEETLQRYPRLRATRLHQMLVSRGYAGSVITLRRYVRSVRPRGKNEAFLRLETLPGEQAQVDWGHFGKLQVGAAMRPLSCFVMVLSYSRAMYARFFLDQRMESFLRGHVEAFESLGGAARTILYDNLKSAVVERDGDHIRYHPRLLELSGHYHCAPKACAPYRGNEKGRVERAIRYLRTSFFAARSFRTLDQLNRQLRTWIDEVAHERPCPGDNQKRSVRTLWREEQGQLLSLPENPFCTDLVRPIRSGKTPYVRFDKNDYSIPHSLIRQPLTLIASETQVRLVAATDEVVATHDRSYDQGQRIEDPAHLDGLAAAKRNARLQHGRHRIFAACPQAESFFAELCARDVPMRPETLRLGRLLDQYGADALDAALTEALARGAVSSASVAHLLEQERRRRNRPPPLDTVLSDDPRVRALRVTPHALGPYDSLSTDSEESPDE